MSQECVARPDEGEGFRVDVAAVEPNQRSRARVRVTLTRPDDVDTAMVRRQLLALYIKELGARVRLPRRRWGKGIRVVEEGSAPVVSLRGLRPEHEVDLDRIARDAADASNVRLAPEGDLGSRLHGILERLG
jgi:hypothetical protein